MKELTLKQVKNTKLKNYFSKDNLRFFNSDTRKIRIIDLDDKLLFLDNIKFEYDNIIGTRTYNIKEYLKNENKINVLLETKDYEEASEFFKKIIEG